MNKFQTLFICFLCQFSLFSQWNDFGIWTKLSLEKKINPRNSVSLTEAFRFGENATDLNTHYTQISYNFELFKNFSIKPSFRNTQKFNFDETIDYKQRVQIDFNYKLKYKNIKFSFRERLQSELKNIKRSDNWQNEKSYFRSKIQLEYDLNKKFTPFISSELYLKLEQPYYLNNIRTKIGLEFEMNKRNSLNINYMIDQDINKNNPLRLFVLGMEYKYSF